MTNAERALLDWFHSPSRGPYEYYRGHLAALRPGKRPPVAALALRMALPCPETGREPELLLAQRRHWDDDYSYLAWKRRV